MEILHRLGIEYEGGSNTPLGTDSSVVFSIHEGDPGWSEIEQIVLEHHSFNLPWTDFTQEETLACERVRLCPGFEKGYPQPDRDMRYVPATFGWTCPSCGLESQ